MTPRREAPSGGTGRLLRGTDQAATKSAFQIVAHDPPTTVDMAYPIVALVAELRPDIPLSVVASLVVESLDLAACLHLDGQWSRARQAMWPEAIKLAHNRHVGNSYASRRAVELGEFS